MNDMLYGHPVYIATKTYQRRKHHKKRINKKWKKRYGFGEINMLPHGKILLMGDVIYMTQKTFEQLKKGT